MTMVSMDPREKLITSVKSLTTQDNVVLHANQRFRISELFVLNLSVLTMELYTS